jgi:surface protein
MYVFFYGYFLYMKKIIILFVSILIVNCSKESEPTMYTLTVTSNPTEGGTISPSGGEYEDGTVLTIRVTPNTNYEFDRWSGSVSGRETSLSITMDSNKSIVGNFVLSDTDGDGVTDDVDTCPNTPSGQTVDSNGCSDSEKDTDGDGVSDDIDQDNNTRSGVPVDDNGVMLNPVYLDENGVTIKSQEWGIVGDVGEIDDVEYTIVNLGMLRDLINSYEILETSVCTSKITNMGVLFYEYQLSFTQRDKLVITSWDVSNVTNMREMFYYSEINLDIGSWDVSSVTNMMGMFWYNTYINDDIGSWDVSNVTNMKSMFKGSPFNGDISNWDVSNVSDMDYIFSGSQFNQDISNWDVSNVTNMLLMFEGTPFNQDIGSWDVSNVNMMVGMFVGTPFNQDIGSWDVSSVNNMGNMFMYTPFNQDIGSWDVSSVSVMSNMFKSNTIFNQDLSNWDVINVESCSDFSNNTPQWTLPKPNFTNCTP